LLARTKGFYATKSKLYRAAKLAGDKAAEYAYIGRRLKKRDFRRLWIVRINAGARQHGLSYSQFMHGLAAASITLDRKSLANLAATEPAAFAHLASQAKEARASDAAAA
jgi:large subunit ribosomal protein L20